MNDLSEMMARRAQKVTSVSRHTEATETKRLSVELPAELMLRLKMKSIHDGISIKNLVIEAIEKTVE